MPYVEKLPTPHPTCEQPRRLEQIAHGLRRPELRPRAFVAVEGSSRRFWLARHSQAAELRVRLGRDLGQTQAPSLDPDSDFLGGQGRRPVIGPRIRARVR